MPQTTQLPTTVSDDSLERQIELCWQRNAEPWIDAVRSGAIASRVQVTDRAIISAVTANSPKSALDLGCGEGWLTRELLARGINTIGVDGSAELISAARQAGVGEYLNLFYRQIAAGHLSIRVDTIICNFCLFGDHSVTQLFQQLPKLLTAGGSVIVQTLHPQTTTAVQKDKNGWQQGSWSGINGNFSDPAPWYYRTIESWQALFEASGLRLLECREPKAEETAEPASIIFIGQAVER